MRQFAQLYATLDETTKTNAKVAALGEYFRTADPADAAWAVYFLIGRRPRMAVNSRTLAGWASEMANLPDWLFAECYDAVGDLAETIALVLPEPEARTDKPLAWWVEQRLLPLAGLDESGQRTTIEGAWRQMSSLERFVFNKLITGAWRVGVSQRLVTRSLSEVSGLETPVVAHRLMGAWEPSATFFETLLSPETEDADISRPFPFFLAHPLQDDPESLGDPEDWQVEWKWDGIRGQIVRRDGRVYLWTRGQELVTERYPEISEAAQAHLPDGTVLDGEILPWADSGVLPFARLQRRIGRKQVTAKLLGEIPVVFLAYDLLEYRGDDVRDRPLDWRRSRLVEVMGVGVQATTESHGRRKNHRGEAPAATPDAATLDGPADALRLAGVIESRTWSDLAALRETSRDRGVEGFMLKRRHSAYGVGRKRGHWWKWKIDPYTVDAVMIYAQRGSGRRASLYTDYTFGVWHEGQLIPIAKAYSGLTDAEIRQVDRFVRTNTLDRFGPVRQVAPELVFELAFEGIRRSNRHKSGVALRFPRMSRWRQDKTADEADRLSTLVALLP